MIVTRCSGRRGGACLNARSNDLEGIQVDFHDFEISRFWRERVELNEKEELRADGVGANGDDAAVIDPGGKLHNIVRRGGGGRAEEEEEEEEAGRACWILCCSRSPLTSYTKTCMLLLLLLLPSWCLSASK